MTLDADAAPTNGADISGPLSSAAAAELWRLHAGALDATATAQDALTAGDVTSVTASGAR